MRIYKHLLTLLCVGICCAVTLCISWSDDRWRAQELSLFNLRLVFSVFRPNRSGWRLDRDMGLMNAIGLQPRHPTPSVTSQGTQTPIVQLQNAETQTERDLSEPSVSQPPPSTYITLAPSHISWYCCIHLPDVDAICCGRCMKRRNKDSSCEIVEKF